MSFCKVRNWIGKMDWYVDGLVNVQCGEAVQKYDIDPFINICLDKERIFPTSCYHL